MAWGFQKENEKLSELEELLKTKFVDIEEDPYPEYRGSLVEIYVSGNGIWGYYRGLTEKGDIILSPYVSTQTFPPGMICEGVWSIKQWNRGLPSHTKFGAVTGIRAADLDFVDKLISYCQREENTDFSI